MKALFNKVISTEFFRFVIVGGISAVIEYSLYFLFKPVLGYVVDNFMAIVLANFAAFVLTNIVTFILTRRYVFASANENKTQEMLLFCLCLGGAFIVNTVTLSILVEYVGVADAIAKAVAIAVTVIWNFFTRKHVVFKNRVAVAAQPAATTPPKEF